MPRQAYVVREGGVQTIAAAMRSHATHSGVLQQACAAIGALNMVGMVASYSSVPQYPNRWV